MRDKIMAAALTALLAICLGSSYWNPDRAAWTVTQLTESVTGLNHNPQVSDDGKTVYFISTCDLTGKNGDHGSDIFKWSDGEIVQVTETPNCVITDLSLAPGANQLAFSSSCHFNGLNPGRGLELMLMGEDGSIQVLTQGRGLPSRHPQWSPDRRRLVFESNADLVQRNPDLSLEIFVADLESSPAVITQITNTVSPYQCEAPYVLADSVICRCNDDVAGTPRPPGVSDLITNLDGRPVAGNPDHNWDLFRFDLDGKPQQLTVTQNCENGPPRPRRDGSLIAFTSNCALSGDPLRQTTRELYFLGAELVRPFPGYSFDGVSLAWSGDGSRLALTSSAAFGQDNLDHNPEIFILELPGFKPGRLQQAFAGKTAADFIRPVTDFAHVTSDKATLSADGAVVVFISAANTNSRNPDGNFEIFMAVRDQSEEEPADSDDDHEDQPPSSETAAPQGGDTTDVLEPPGHVAPPSIGP